MTTKVELEPAMTRSDVQNPAGGASHALPSVARLACCFVREQIDTVRALGRVFGPPGGRRQPTDRIDIGYDHL